MGSGSSLSAVSRGGRWDTIFLGFGGAAAWAGGAAVGEALGADAALGGESPPAAGAGPKGIGMNGLTRPSLEAGGLARLAGGIEELVAGAGAAAAAGGAEEGAAAGVCASAPETRRGAPNRAPTIQIRSVMHKDPHKGRASCAPATHSLCPLRLIFLAAPDCRGGARLAAQYAASA